MSKLLITSGCSFSECVHYENPAFQKNWPIYLSESLKDLGYTEHKSSALPSQGNGLISRGVIYNVIEALKTHKPEDILVGVMWSGYSRHDFRCTDPGPYKFEGANVYQNPTQFVKNALKKWIILNVNWAEFDDLAENYYKNFFDDLGHMIYSLEHILRTQWFLKSKNIPYFFTNIGDNNIVFPGYIDNPEIKYLLDQVDHTNYLPVSSEFQWLVDNEVLLHEWEEDWKHYHSDGNGYHWLSWVHPTTNQHKVFVDKVILPWLKEKYAGIVFNG